MTIRPIVAGVGVVLLGVIATNALRAGAVAANDGLPPLDIEQAVRFTVPTTIRPAVDYSLSADFAGDEEQNVDVFVWSQETNDTGRWERRAFYNNYWQGKSVRATLRLEAGRSYAAVLHHKPTVAPAYGPPWSQAKMLSSESTPDKASGQTAVRADFASPRGTATRVTLDPILPANSG